jgi:hypothetical protein
LIVYPLLVYVEYITTPVRVTTTNNSTTTIGTSSPIATLTTNQTQETALSTPTIFLQNLQDPTIKWHILGVFAVDFAMFYGCLFFTQNVIKIPLPFKTTIVSPNTTIGANNLKPTWEIARLSVGLLIKSFLRLVTLLILLQFNFPKPTMVTLIQLSGYIGGSLVHHGLTLNHIPYPARIVAWLKMSFGTLSFEVICLWLPVGIIVMSFEFNGLWGSLLKVRVFICCLWQ